MIMEIVVFYDNRMNIVWARGLLNLRNSGAHTIAQDEQSSVVFGMPKEAILLGAAEKIVSLSDVPDTLLKMIQQ